MENIKKACLKEVGDVIQFTIPELFAPLQEAYS